MDCLAHDLGVGWHDFSYGVGSWDRWQSGPSEQRTDDAYMRADVASLSTKASGVILTMAVQEYEHVKAGQVIATIKGDDYQTQVEAAQAALDGSTAQIPELAEQERIADEKVQQAGIAIKASQQQATAAEAAVTAARAAVTGREEHFASQCNHLLVPQWPYTPG